VPGAMVTLLNFIPQIFLSFSFRPSKFSIRDFASETSLLKSLLSLLFYIYSTPSLRSVDLLFLLILSLKISHTRNFTLPYSFSFLPTRSTPTPRGTQLFRPSSSLPRLRCLDRSRQCRLSSRSFHRFPHSRRLSPRQAPRSNR
jgi:hypothetical protein